MLEVSKELLDLGSFPESSEADSQTLERQEGLAGQSDSASDGCEEASALCAVFGPDDYYGLAWTLLHFIEFCPRVATRGGLAGASNQWIERLRRRVENAKRVAD